MSTPPTLLEEFQKLFPSNNDSLVVRKTPGTRNPETGKLDGAEYTTYRRAIRVRDIELHLAGEACLVAKPELSDGTCRWAMLDHDIYKDDQAKLSILSKVGELKLPLHVFESKSGGLHSAAFFESPIPCGAARKLLSQWAAQLGDPKAEIFPKPVANGKLPYGISLPFFGEPERFKSFIPLRFKPVIDGSDSAAPKNGDIPDYLQTDAPQGFENTTPDDFLLYAIKLPEGINFEAELKKHKLQFKKREVDGGISFDYHNYSGRKQGCDPGGNGQPCLLAGIVHKNNEQNIRCSRFFEKNGYVVHHCFDDDGLPPEEKGRTRKALAALGIEFNDQPQPSSPPHAAVEALKDGKIQIPDMPESVLDGRLGEICQSRMKDFPFAFSWPSLLTAAGVLVQPMVSKLRANLYTALVSEVGEGKSTAIGQANFLPPLLETLKAGSAEGLLGKLGDQKGNRVLYAPDELSHLLEKTQIASASFPYILNSLFYRDEEYLTIRKGKQVKFNCRLSIIGGLISTKFDDSFSTASTGGLYDRFLYGRCPSGFEYLWRPIEGEPAFTELLDDVPVNPDVWEARDHLRKEEGLKPRVLEIALRCAGICAAFDGRRELRAADLGPAWELARYETRVRALLQPNTGKNFEGQVSLKILNYLDQYAPDGKWLVLRDVLRAIHAYDFGPSVVQRCLTAMEFGGYIEQVDQPTSSKKKRKLLRLAGEILP